MLDMLQLKRSKSRWEVVRRRREDLELREEGNFVLYTEAKPGTYC
jgi:hypothetical protein